MARLEQAKEKGSDQSFLSVIFDKKVSKKKLAVKEKSKVNVFEKGLASELSNADTIEQSIEKMVKMALTCEFGASFLTKSGSKRMVSTISRGILSDSELRRNALIIADRFAKEPGKKMVTLREKRKNIING